MLTGAVEIVQYAQELGDHRDLGPVGSSLLLTYRTLAVVVVFGLDALQSGFQFRGLIDGRLGSRLRRRPTGGRAGGGLTNFARVGIDAPFVGESHRLVRIAHFFSW